MSVWVQILTVVGLIFELFSVYWSVKRLLKNYYERLGTDTYRQKIEKEK